MQRPRRGSDHEAASPAQGPFGTVMGPAVAGLPPQRWTSITKGASLSDGLRWRRMFGSAGVRYGHVGGCASVRFITVT